MIPKLSFCSPVRRNLFLQTLTHFPSNFSVFAESNISSSNAPSENLFLHFITARFNVSSADAAKMVKTYPSLGRLKSFDNVEQVVSILDRFGCTEDQIVRIIKYQPKILTRNAEKVLEPKIQLLKDIGTGRENMTKCVSQLPRILTSKLETLRSNLELLKTVFPTQDLLMKAIMKNNILGKNLQGSFKASVAFWEGFGFRGTELTKFLLVNPWVLTHSSLTPGQCDLILKIGIHKEDNMYRHIVNMVAMSRIEVLEARMLNFQFCGLSLEETFSIIRINPLVLSKSEENIKKMMDFMLNQIGVPVDFVAKHPRMFSMSLDKVIRPRFLVLQGIAAIDGAGEVKLTRLHSILMMTEAKFVAQIIQGHSEYAALWTIYKNSF